MTLRALLALATLLLAGQGSAAQVPAVQPVQPEAVRPRVALVLSGGGARGFAHIGVLRALRDMRVPIDMVVGTSMGSVVGGAYAAGASVQGLEATVRETDWDRVVADRPARDTLAFRRREEDRLLASRIEFGVSREGATLPPSAAGNAELEAALDRLLPAGTRNKPVSQLALPFRSVASDLLTGELVDLVDTPLFITMRASLAVPGVFAPVRVNDRLVVDGGLVRNLPVDLARAMGADVVIAVNVGTPLAPESELDSAVGVAQQMLNILTEQNVQRSLRELGPNDILVSPDLSGITFLDFQRHEEAIRAGEEAVLALHDRLAPLAVAPEAYALLDSRRQAPPREDTEPRRIGRLVVTADGRLNPKALARQSGLREGEPATREDVRRAASILYGRGDVARVETEVSDAGGVREVGLSVTEAPWARNRARVGLELASDFADTNDFAIKFMHVNSNLNPSGAELRTVLRVGTQREFGVQYMQPMGAGSPWYVAPSIGYGARAIDLFGNGRRLMRVGVRISSATLAAGHNLGDWGDLQGGVRRQKGAAWAVLPEYFDLDPSDGWTPPTGDEEQVTMEPTYDTTHFLRYRIDTLDSTAFPTRGLMLDAVYERSPGSSDEVSLATSSVVGMAAFGRGLWAGHVYGEWARASEGIAPLSLGGFMRLSGTKTQSVDGRSIALARLAMARKIGALPFTLGGAMRVGFSLEVGGGFDHADSAPRPKFRQAGSAFLSVDTRFGPAYLAAGATRGGGNTLYLFLGPIW